MLNDLTVISPSEAWKHQFDRLPEPLRDVHFSFGFAEMQGTLGGERLLLVLNDGADFMMQPVLKRETPWLGLHDITSLPNGFGGPVSNIQDEKKLLSFRIEFRMAIFRWAADNGIVSEFCYLNPLLSRHQDHCASIVPVRETVAINLLDFSEKTVSRRVTRGIKTSEMHDAKIRRLTTQDGYERFYYLYKESMERKDAAKHWYLPLEYFTTCRELVKSLLLEINADAGTRMLLVIGAGDKAYAHLLASDGEGRRNGLDESLYFTAATTLKAEGYKTFFLGGGMTSAGQDSLLAFKSGFSKDKLSLGRYTRIFDASAYAALVKLKLEKENIFFGIESGGNPHFFPQYRRPW